MFASKKIIFIIIFVLSLTACSKKKPAEPLNDTIKEKMEYQASTKLEFDSDLGITALEFEKKLSSQKKQQQKNFQSVGTIVDGSEYQVIHYPIQSDVYVLAITDKSTNIIKSVDLIAPVSKKNSLLVYPVFSAASMRITDVIAAPGEKNRVKDMLKTLEKELTENYTGENKKYIYSKPYIIGSKKYTIVTALTGFSGVDNLLLKIEPNFE